MDFLLLAAGIGSRLKPLTDTIPKCLIDINDKPLLAYWLEKISKLPNARILINTHYQSDKVKTFIESNFSHLNITISYEKDLLGTGGTLKKNKDFFTKDEPFMVIHADNFSIFNINDFIKAHSKAKSNPQILMTMMTFKTDKYYKSGILDIQNNLVKNFYEKSKIKYGEIANAAIYIFEYKLLEIISNIKTDNIDISKDVIPKLMNKISTFENDIYHEDIGDIDSLKKVRKDFNYLFNQYKDLI